MVMEVVGVNMMASVVLDLAEKLMDVALVWNKEVVYQDSFEFLSTKRREPNS